MPKKPEPTPEVKSPETLEPKPKPVPKETEFTSEQIAANFRKGCENGHGKMILVRRDELLQLAKSVLE